MISKLAIVCSHPIQYYAPVFSLLAKHMEVHVFYTLGQKNVYDKGFNQAIEWDVPLLEGYNYTFLTNQSTNKGTHHFRGISNPTLNFEVEEFNPDAILLYGWAYQSHLQLLRHFKGKKIIYFRGDSTLINKPGIIKATLKKIFLSWVYKHVDFAFYVGTQSKAYFRAFGLKESSLIFAPHAIDNDRFAKKKNQNELRKKLGIDSATILILFAGKFVDVKNPILLLHAFKQLNPNNASLLFVGDGPLHQELTLLSNSSENIFQLPFQNQSMMPQVYAACDIFCLPSKSETWGLAVNEAMASGKAILTSDAVGCSIDLVEEGINGSVFKSNNLEDLKIKLSLLISSQEKLTEMGKHSLLCIQNFSIENQVSNMMKAFKA